MAKPITDKEVFSLILTRSMKNYCRTKCAPILTIFFQNISVVSEKVLMHNTA